MNEHYLSIGSQDNPVILNATVGSRAYGLDHAGSDRDELGIFVRPTQDFFGLTKYNETYRSPEGSRDDWTLHEAGKFARLALKCNPTLLELLWLDKYSTDTEWGISLRERREAFLSQRYVRDAYMGYVTQQMYKIVRRETTNAKSAKNARHLWRLTQQGTELWTRGTMSVRLSLGDADACRAFGEDVANGHNRVIQDRINWAVWIFEDAVTVLPAEPGYC